MQETTYSDPYLNDRIIHEPDRLYGRGELFKRIFAVIAVYGSISIVGPSRIGKGSLLNCLRFEEFQSRYGGAYAKALSRKLFVFVDLRIYAHRSWDNFFKGVNREIVKQCRGIIDLGKIPIEGSEGFTALLDEIADQEYSLVLALDSFEKLRENEPLSNDLPMFLRSEAARVSYVVASTMQLYEIFPKEPMSSPFYNIFLYREKIGVLAPADAQAMVVMPAKEAGLPFTAREVAWILKQAGAHPFFLQFVCHMLFEKKAAAPMEFVDLEEMEDEIYEAFYPQFEALWQVLDEREREKFRYELRQEGLEEFYGSSLYRRFVEEQAGGKAGLQVKDIKEALKRLSKPSDLGKSRLRQLKVVKRYLNDHTQASQSEIGVAIREVLFVAWDHIKGQGHRTDSGPEWESYNILFYCYFKHHMQNEQLGARLGVSTRTLYRKKNEALEKLFIAVLEMEDAGLTEKTT
jgi:hypothetical protein